MKLGIMQPYFMPYIGYFSLIKHTDRFILFDTVQFIRHGWIERNRILKPDGGWQYIQIPINRPDGRDTVIKDILINNKENWKDRILAQLQHYKKKALYYFKVTDLLKDVFSHDYNDIVSLNKASLQAVCEYLGIIRDIDVFSEMDLNIKPADAPDEWALNICTALDADEYWNPPGGQSFFDRKKYDEAGVKLFFQNVSISEYSQKRDSFEGGLSIIDVMMFNSVDDINEMLDRYELL